jgi:hypothetical protein
MRGRAKLLWLSTSALVLSAYVLCRAGPQNPRQETDLKVRIIPDKTTYVLREKVFTKIEFRNSGSKTYCFPKPTRDCTNDYPGSVVTEGRPVPDAGEFDSFICHFDSGGPRAADLVLDIKQHWIQLGPNAEYVTESAEAIVSLNKPGEWVLETTYLYPTGAFHPAAVKKELTLAAERVGCTMPAVPILGEPVTIHVVAATKDH